MIIYPTSNFESWISEDDADTYFESRLNVSAWDTANKEVALMTAFRSLQELDLSDGAWLGLEKSGEGDSRPSVRALERVGDARGACWRFLL